MVTLDLYHPDGWRIYECSLAHISLCRRPARLPGRAGAHRALLSKGLYCRVVGETPVGIRARRIDYEMQRIISETS